MDVTELKDQEEELIQKEKPQYVMSAKGEICIKKKLPKKKKLKIKKTKTIPEDEDPEPISESDDDSSSSEEEEEPRLNIFSWDSEIKEEYGVGVYIYFDFLKALMLLNLILGVLQSICYFYDLIFHFDKYRKFSLDNLMLFASSLDPGASKIIWIVSSYLILVISIIFGPIYFVKIYRECTHWNHELKFNDNISKNKNQNYQFLRMCISFLVSIGFGLLTALVNAVIVYVQQELSQIYKKYSGILVTVSSSLIGGVIALGGQILPAIAVWLNKKEALQSRTLYRISYISKLCRIKSYNLLFWVIQSCIKFKTTLVHLMFLDIHI